MSSLGADISRYHIRLRSAHTILTQACLGLLLYSDAHVNPESVACFPLTRYATGNWVEHAHFEDVASRVKDGMESLFDPDKPHFAAWADMYFIPDPWRPGDSEIRNPLYYSVICGFDDLMEHLAIKHPHYINVVGGKSQNPLIAALFHNRLKAAEFLLAHGADVDAQGADSRTILLMVILRYYYHDNLPSVVKFLLKHGADVNARDDSLTSLLHHAVNCQLEVAQILLKHKADINAHDNTGKTPLHALVKRRVGDTMEQVYNDHVQLLLEYGADMNRRDKNNDTPLHLATLCKNFKIAIIFLGHGADPNVKNNDSKTPLHILMQCLVFGDFEALHPRIRYRFLSGEEAGMSPGDGYYSTPSLYQPAFRWGYFDLAGVLVENGADPNTELESDAGVALLHILVSEKAPSDNFLHLALLFLEHGAEVNKLNRFKETPLHLAIRWKQFKLAELLLEHGADPNAQDVIGSTPMHALSVAEIEIENEDNVLNFAHVLLKHGAGVNRQDDDNQTPLHIAIRCHRCKLAKILVEHGANPNAEDNNGKTPFHKLLEFETENEDDVLDLAHVLLEYGSEVNRRDKHNRTPLHAAIRCHRCKLAKILVEHGANPNAEDNNGKNPFHKLSEFETENEDDVLDLAHVLLEYGSEVNRRDKHNRTPLHAAIRWDMVKLARILVEHGADTNAENNHGMTPLHLLIASNVKDQGDILNLALLLLKHGAEVNRRNKVNETPLNFAIRREQFNLAGILLEHGANANAENNNGETPLRLLSGSRNYDEGDFINHARLLLLKNGMGATRGDGDNSNVLLPWGNGRGKYNFIEIIIDPRADAQSNVSPFQISALLLHHGATLNARQKNGGGPESPSCPEIEGVYYIQSYRVTT
jgi:ankyrin repeat protein